MKTVAEVLKASMSGFMGKAKAAQAMADLEFNWAGKALYVRPSGLVYTNTYYANGYTSITTALGAAAIGDVLFFAPGTYDEAVVIALAKKKIVMIGDGPRGSVSVTPSATNAIALTCNAEDVQSVNIDWAGNGTGGGALFHGRRFTDILGKYEGGAFAINLQADQANYDDNSAPSNDASDVCFKESEFAWATAGIKFNKSTGNGTNGVTEPRFEKCKFHNLTTHITDSGEASVLGLQVSEAEFMLSEAGALPTKFLTLNNVNSTGQLMSCRYAVASAGLAALVNLAANMLNVDVKTAA